MDEQQEIVTEFLIESAENLNQLDQDFVELEQSPDDRELLSSIFRTIHTIKGTCGFLGFHTLEAVTHRAENLLSQLREGERRLTPELTTLLLETVDVVKGILGSIEKTGGEGDDQYSALRERLEAVADAPDGLDAAEAEDDLDEAVEEADDVEAEADSIATAEDDSSSEDDSVVELTPAAARKPAPQAASAAQEHDEERSAHPHRLHAADANIRVDVDLLDSLMNLVGELVLARNQILQYTDTQEDAGFTGASQRLNLITTELQANVMKTRMQPIRIVWSKFPRVVRDLGQSFGKQIELAMEGADTELDKTIIEAIKDPLTHIVRNSCDHGIESPEVRVAAGKPPRGRLLLRAYHEGGQVNIEISDDGGGIDTQRLKQKALQKGLIQPEQAERMNERELLELIFLPGFSTAAKITNVSGRGVGMDVVRTNIEKIGGSIDLHSRLGEGATIKIKIPLTLAIIPALVVTCGGERFAIPQVNLLELVRVEPGQEQQIEQIHGSPVFRLRGKLLPLVFLHEVLQLEPQAEDESVNIIVLQADEQAFGLVVDGVSDTAEIVVKPLSKLLKGISCYAGATIMGDGKVALILDVMGLAQMGGALTETRSHGRSSVESSQDTALDKQAVLLFRCGDRDRLAAPLALVDRLEEFPRDRVERSGGRLVVQYRNRILPLAPLSDTIGGGGGGYDDDKLQAVVFSYGDRRVGVVVDEILDIVEEQIRVRSASSERGIQGTAVVGGKVTEFIDLRSVLAGCDEDWFDGRSEETSQPARVLLVEPSAFARGLMRGDLEGAGYRVVEAIQAEDALSRLRRGEYDLLACSLDLPAPGAAALVERARAQSDHARLPALGLANPGSTTHVPGFDRCLDKFDRSALLRAAEELTAPASEAAGVLR
ncbi:MAG: histidine kinase [Acidobacteria bacterium]|nr:histidine kinase [Acidobacteriota bacterium]